MSQSSVPDNTAVRTALWRALHVEQDAAPHVFEDTIGLQLAAPDEGWRNRPDMSAFTRPFRASIVARARFVEDLVAEKQAQGATQYVILGAGLDTFAQRNAAMLAKGFQVFEIDQSTTQEWKKGRLQELGMAIGTSLHFVPVNFEAGDSWWECLRKSGFNPKESAVVASMGVSMYLTKDAVLAMLKQASTLSTGSALVMSFMLPIEMNDPEIRPGVERAAQGAKASGTPWLSFFTPTEMLALAREAGFSKVEHVSAESLGDRYFASRTDGLRPPRNSEEILVAIL